MSTATTLVDRASRVLRSSVFWWLILVAYASAVTVLLTPVLVTSVGADERYWVLDSSVRFDQSVWDALLSSLPEILRGETLGQPRNSQLSVGLRRAVAIIVLESARFFGVPVAVPWAILKLTLVILAVAGAVVIMRLWRFRRRDGAISPLSRQSVAFIAITLPLGIAVGIKADSYSFMNGWLQYPLLTYGAAPFAFGVIAVALVCVRMLDRNFARSVVPAVLALALVALLVNFSYELALVSVPLALGAVLLQASESERPWRARAVTVGVLGGAFSAVFVINRLRLALAPCHETGSCYAGTVFTLDGGTILRNFAGAFPIVHDPRVIEEAAASGAPLPEGVTGAGTGIAVIAILLCAVVWLSWKARSGGMTPVVRYPDVRGLLALAGLGLALAIGVSLLSATTASAVERVIHPSIPYRSGPAAWTGLALAALAMARLARVRLSPRRWSAAIPAAALAVIAGLIVSFNFSLNTAFARMDRERPVTVATDQLSWEVVLGQPGEAADARRCSAADAYADATPATGYYQRTLEAAYAAYRMYHGAAFCSTGAGLDRVVTRSG